MTLFEPKITKKDQVKLLPIFTFSLEKIMIKVYLLYVLPLNYFLDGHCILGNIFTVECHICRIFLFGNIVLQRLKFIVRIRMQTCYMTNCIKVNDCISQHIITLPHAQYFTLVEPCQSIHYPVMLVQGVFLLLIFIFFY